MLGLILGVQKVELVGGESWLEHNTIALAAIAAAGLAALVAILNRRAELKHDREMRNKDHIREILDLSYVEVGQAMKKVSELMGIVHGTEEWRKQDELEPDDAFIETVDRELAEKRADAHAAIMNLATATGRLEMRLGQKHPIAKAHRKVRKTIRAFHDRAPTSVEEDRQKDERETDDQVSDEVASAHSEFREACFKWINE